MEALGTAARESKGPHGRAAGTDAVDGGGGELLWTSRPARSIRTADWSVQPRVPDGGAGLKRKREGGQFSPDKLHSFSSVFKVNRSNTSKECFDLIKTQ